MNALADIFIVGIVATVVMDIWGILRKRLLGIAVPNYGLVGRWFAHMARGRFRHESIAASQAAPFESVIGWCAHYAIGIAFAGVLIGIWGPAWMRHPTIAPALTVGIVGVAAPFLLMQPGMGAGIASSRTAHPKAARMQSLITHAVFGFGLYVGGLLAHILYSFL